MFYISYSNNVSGGLKYTHVTYIFVNSELLYALALEICYIWILCPGIILAVTWIVLYVIPERCVEVESEFIQTMVYNIDWG